MKEIIATEKILSPLGHTIAIKYHYEDGSSRVVPKVKSDDHVSDAVKSIIDSHKK